MAPKSACDVVLHVGHYSKVHSASELARLCRIVESRQEREPKIQVAGHSQFVCERVTRLTFSVH